MGSAHPFRWEFGGQWHICSGKLPADSNSDVLCFTLRSPMIKHKRVANTSTFSMSGFIACYFPQFDTTLISVVINWMTLT